MDYTKTELIDMVKARCLTYGDFTLSSGAKSNCYLDLRKLTLYSRGLDLVVELICRKTDDLLNLNAIGGLATGAIPIIGALLNECYGDYPEINGFYVRPAPKEHGSKNLVEGNLPINSKVLVVDDVVTSGKSILKIIDVVEERSCELVGIVSIVDRLQGSQELLKPYNYMPLLTIKDLGL